MWFCDKCGFEAKYFRDLWLHHKQTGHRIGLEFRGRKLLTKGKFTMIRRAKAV